MPRTSVSYALGPHRGPLPAHHGPGGWCRFDRLYRWWRGLALVTRRRAEDPPGNARGQSLRRDGEVARRGGLRRRSDRRRPQLPRPDLALFVVQGLGAERHVHRRGAAQRPQRMDLIRLPARLRRDRGRRAHGLRLLEQRLVLSDQLRAGHLRSARDEQLARSDQRLRRGAPDAVRQQDDRPHGRDGERAGRSGPLRHELLPLARPLRDRTRPPPHRRGRERPARRNRAGAVGQRRADSRQDRRGGDPGRRPAAQPCRRRLLYANCRGRQGRVALPRRDANRLDRRRRPEGGGNTHLIGRPVRADLASGHDLADRLAGRDRRSERGGVPARVRRSRPGQARRRPAGAPRRWPPCRESSRPRRWPAPRASPSRSRSPAPAR